MDTLKIILRGIRCTFGTRQLTVVCFTHSSCWHLRLSHGDVREAWRGMMSFVGRARQRIRMGTLVTRLSSMILVFEVAREVARDLVHCRSDGVKCHDLCIMCMAFGIDG